MKERLSSWRGHLMGRIKDSPSLLYSSALASRVPIGKPAGVVCRSFPRTRPPCYSHTPPQPLHSAIHGRVDRYSVARVRYYTRSASRIFSIPSFPSLHPSQVRFNHHDYTSWLRAMAGSANWQQELYECSGCYHRWWNL